MALKDWELESRSKVYLLYKKKNAKWYISMYSGKYYYGEYSGVFSTGWFVSLSYNLEHNKYDSNSYKLVHKAKGFEKHFKTKTSAFKFAKAYMRKH